VLPIVERLLQDAENLKRAGEDFARQDRGVLTIAATHSQARYAMPAVVHDFRALHPHVVLRMRQGTAHQIAEMLLAGEADLGVATEALATYPGLLALPSYQWTHAVIVPPQHPLAVDAAAGVGLTIERLAKYPIITYETGYTGRSHIDEGFRHRGLMADIVLEALDADVIKTYVELGLGVGIVASIAFDESRDRNLCAIEAGHLFAPNTTHVAVRRGSYLRAFVYDFIRTFAAPLTREVVEQALIESGASTLGG
jgi:LysR family cys regulon transcriptional activator